MTRHVEIAGGGFTGLVMGTALAQAGWTARVHERTEEIRAFGAGIWIWDNGVRVLKAIGAADSALEGCTEAPTYISRDAKGRYIDEVPFAPITSKDQSRMFCITRQQLLAAILGAAAARGRGNHHQLAGDRRTAGGRAHHRGRARVAGGPGHRRRWDQLQRAGLAGPAEEPQAPRGRRHPRARAARAGLCRHRGRPHHPRVVERLSPGALHALQPRCVLLLLHHARAGQGGGPDSRCRGRSGPRPSRTSHR